MASSPSSTARVGSKRQPCGIFSGAPEIDAAACKLSRLFVPRPFMWALHEASKPIAVATRAELMPRIFGHWVAKHRTEAPWLAGWLYGDERPDNAGDFTPTEKMHAFRREAQVGAILRAALVSLSSSWVGSRERRAACATRSDIQRARRLFRSTYPSETWLEGWMLRGEEAPAEVRVATPGEVERCAAAWDYLNLCKRAGIGKPHCHYWVWFGRAAPALPPGKDRPAWLRWLYGLEGYRRAPSFVVTRELQAYRHTCRVLAVAEAAGVGRHALGRLRRDPAARELLNAATRTGAADNPPDDSKLTHLDAEARANLRALLAAATPAARCNAAGLDVRRLNALLRDADDRGVRAALADYLDMRGQYRRFRRASALRFGLQGDGLFIPPIPMCDFHEAAVKAWAEQRVTELDGLPGFEDWFVSWVTPSKPRNGVTSGTAAAVRPPRERIAGTTAAPDSGAMAVAATRQAATGYQQHEPRPPRETRKKRSRELHLWWAELTARGHSDRAIVKLTLARRGKKVTPQAVASARKKLAAEPQAGRQL